MDNFNGIEARQIPDSFNVLRLLMDYEYNDFRIGIYDVDAYNTNFVNPLFCICDELGTPSGDIVDILEDTLHEIIQYGGTPETVREIMGLVREEDLAENDLDPNSPDFEGIHIDLGYYLPCGINSFEVAPADFAALDEVFTHAQRTIAATADYYDLDILSTTALLSHDFTDWQASQIARAFRDGIDFGTIKLIADPKYNHAQMRELFKLAKDLEAMNANDAFGYGIAKDMSATKPAEWMREVRLLITQHGDEGLIDLPWQELSIGQIAAVRATLDCDIPIEQVKLFAKREYNSLNMELIGRAMLRGMDKPYLNYLLDPTFDPVQLAEVMDILTPTALSSMPTNEQLDYIVKPEYSAHRMGVLRNAFMILGLDIETVDRYNNGKFTPGQMATIYGCLVDPDMFSDAQIEQIANPALTEDEMLDLKHDFLWQNIEANTPTSFPAHVQGGSKAASLSSETKDTRHGSKALEDASRVQGAEVADLAQEAADARHSSAHDNH